MSGSREHLSSSNNFIFSNTSKVNSSLSGNGSSPILGIALPITPVALMFGFGVVGNILALIRLIYTAKQHQWRTFYRLVAALSVSDFIGLAGSLPISLNAYANGSKWIGGQHLCNFMSFVLIFAGMASAMIACFMSLDRLCAIMFPHFYSRSMTKNKTINSILVAILVFSLLVACLPLAGINSNVKQYPGTWCFFNHFADDTEDQFFAYFYALLGASMILVMLISNTVVIAAIGKRCIGSGNGVHRTSGKSRVNEVYNMVFLTVLMIVFTVCWVPLCVRIIINQTNKVPMDHKADLLVMRLALVNQIMDPWTYILLRKDIVEKLINFGKRHSSAKSIFNQIHDGEEENCDEISFQTQQTLTTCSSLTSVDVSVNVNTVDKISH